MIAAGKMADLVHEYDLFEIRSILNLRHLNRKIAITFGSKLPLQIEFVSLNAIIC